MQTENKNLKRPFWNDEMLNELAQVVGKELFDWSNEDGSDDTGLEDCVISARKVLRYHSNDNGYEIAKAFEDEGFSPDAELVEILDSVSFSKHQIQDKFIKDWVKNNNIKLDYEVGQKVKAQLSKPLGLIECEIVKLYPESLQYGLWCEQLGWEKGTGHRLVNAENVIEKID